MKKSLTLSVNGQEHQVEVESNRLLLQVLRDSLGLTGTKKGCSIDVCGACSVNAGGSLVGSRLTRKRFTTRAMVVPAQLSVLICACGI